MKNTENALQKNPNTPFQSIFIIHYTFPFSAGVSMSQLYTLAMQHVDLSSPTRGWNLVPQIGRAEPYPLDHQEA